MSGRRFFVGLATSTYDVSLDIDDRPELLDAARRMRKLFVEKLKFEAVDLSPDCSIDDLRRGLSELLTDHGRRADDTVVFYYTGHGLVRGNTFFLPFPETTGDLWRSALDGGSLAQWLIRGTVVRNWLIILDTCHAAAAIPSITADAFQELTPTRGLEQMPSVAVVAAARPGESATSLAFTDAFIEAVLHESTARHEPPHLPLASIVKRTKRHVPKWQNVTWHLGGDPDAVDGYLPNPRYNPHGQDLDLRTRDVLQEALRRAEMDSHVWPRAQGLDVPMEGRHLFTGRTAVMVELCRWLDDDSGESLVVTGGPGSGKSALLARLFVLSDPVLRKRIPNANAVPASAMPADRSIKNFIHARGKTADEVLAGLAAAAETVAETTTDLLATLRQRGGPTVTVIVDAVDEADDEHALVRDVLAPIIRNSDLCHLRLLLGTREHLLQELDGRTIDIDAEGFADPASVRAYAKRCLLELVPDNPYLSAPEVADTVAQAVGQAAGRSFLVALITARSLALRPAVVADPADPRWRARLPRAAASAMERDIEERLGDQAGKARDLLLPLAYAEGAGLPWEDVWAPVASQLAGHTYSDADIEWLIRHAGYYIIEAQEDGRSTYRLYHEALADHLRAITDADSPAGKAAVQRKILHGLRSTIGGLSWSEAHPYIRRHLASHAGPAGALDEYFSEPAYLLLADRARLLAAATWCRSDQGRRAALAFQQATNVGIVDPSVRLAYLGLAARQYGADRLATSVASAKMPVAWRTVFARWSPAPPHQAVGRLMRAVHTVGVTLVDGQPTIIASTETAVHYWSLDSGRAVAEWSAPGDKLLEHAVMAGAAQDGGPLFVRQGSRIYAVQLAGGLPTARVVGRIPWLGKNLTSLRTRDGWHCVAYVLPSKGDTVRVLISDGGRPHLDIRMADRPSKQRRNKSVAPINHLATLRTTGGDYLVTSTDGKTVRIWNPQTAELACQWTMPGKPLVRLLGVEANGRPAVVAVSSSGPPSEAVAESAYISEALRNVRARSDAELRVAERRPEQTVYIWFPPLSGEAEFQTSFDVIENVSALAVESVDARAYLITGAHDGAIRIRDLESGELEYESPLGHSGVVTSLATHRATSRSVIVSGGEDGTVRVWDLGPHLPSRTAGTRMHEAWTVGLIGDSPARTIVAGVGEIPGDPVQRHTMLVHDLESRSLPRVLNRPGAPVSMQCVINYGDRGLMLTTATQDCIVYAWDTLNGFTGMWMAHEQPILAMSGLAIGAETVLFTASMDATVVAWDATQRRRYRTIWQGQGDVPTALCAVTVFGRAALVIGTEAGRVLLVDASSGRALAPPLALQRSIRAIIVRPERGMALVTTATECIALGISEAGFVSRLFRGHSVLLERITESAVAVQSGACSPRRGLWVLASGDRVIVGDEHQGVTGEIDVWSAVRDVAVADDGTIAVAAENGLLLLRLNGFHNWPMSLAMDGLSRVLTVKGSLGSALGGQVHEPEWEPNKTEVQRPPAFTRADDYRATDDGWAMSWLDDEPTGFVARSSLVLVVIAIVAMIVAAPIVLVRQSPTQAKARASAFDLSLSAQVLCDPESPMFPLVAPMCQALGVPASGDHP